MSRNPDRCPTHPGELLREDVIPETGKSKTEIARLLGISRQHLHDVGGGAQTGQPRGRRAPGKAVRERTAVLDQDAGCL